MIGYKNRLNDCFFRLKKEILFLKQAFNSIFKRISKVAFFLFHYKPYFRAELKKRSNLWKNKTKKQSNM